MNSIDCYTDASYSKEVGGSIIGYKIGDEPIVTEFLDNIKNTQAELIAVERCIATCKEKYPTYQIHIYTDCQKAIQNQNNNTNDVIYHKMIGHIKKSLRDDKQTIFSLVDKITRKELRKKYKEIQEQR